MAKIVIQRKQHQDPAEYAITPGDRDTEYIEVGDAYPLPVKQMADASGSLLSTEQFLGMMLAELVLMREALQDLAATSYSP